MFVRVYLQDLLTEHDALRTTFEDHVSLASRDLSRIQGNSNLCISPTPTILVGVEYLHSLVFLFLLSSTTLRGHLNF